MSQWLLVLIVSFLSPCTENLEPFHLQCMPLTFQCPVRLITFHKSFVFLKVTVLTACLKACWIQPASHKLSATDWSVNWYILADRSLQESSSARPRQSVACAECKAGRWQIFMTTWQLLIIPKGEVNRWTASKCKQNSASICWGFFPQTNWI